MLALTRAADAAPAVPTRLVWHGTVCGTAEDFAARVAQRTTMVRFVRRGHQLAVRLHIERQGSGLDARVSIEARGKASMIRHIESPDCEDALDALALVVAIGVEARAADTSVRRRSGAPPPPLAPAPLTIETPVPPAPPSTAAPEPTPVPVVPNESAPPPATTEPTPAVEPPALLPPPVVAVEPLVPAANEPATETDESGAPSETGASSDAIDVSAGLAAQMSWGIAPDPMIGGGLWLAASWDGGGVWSPELLLVGVHQRLDGFRAERGAVDFSLSALTIALCPLRWGTERLFVRPCAAGALGRLAAQGYDTFDPRSTGVLWSAFGASIDWIARAGIMEFRAQLGAGAPLSREKYGFGTGCSGSACEADVFHRVEPVIWSGALSAGIHMW